MMRHVGDLVRGGMKFCLKRQNFLSASVKIMFCSYWQTVEISCDVL